MVSDQSRTRGRRSQTFMLGKWKKCWQSNKWTGERDRKQQGWMRRNFRRQHVVEGGRRERSALGEARAGSIAWPPPSSTQKQKLLLDSMPACACTYIYIYTCMHVYSCLSPMARIGVNKSPVWFNKSQRDVTGKWEENSWLVLAGCGYLSLTRTARRQAQCRWNEAMGWSRAKEAPCPDRPRCDMTNPNHPGHLQDSKGRDGGRAECRDTAPAWAQGKRWRGRAGKGALEHLVLDWAQEQA